MRLLLTAIMVCGLCGCTTIKRESTAPDGTKTVYVVSSTLNRKAIDGLYFKDCAGCVELSLTNYTSEQDTALQVLQAALEAYLKTKAP